jgi:hypothetical protein
VFGTYPFIIYIFTSSSSDNSIVLWIFVLLSIFRKLSFISMGNYVTFCRRHRHHLSKSFIIILSWICFVWNGLLIVFRITGFVFDATVLSEIQYRKQINDNILYIVAVSILIIRVITKLPLSVYIILSFDFPFVRLFGVR